MAVGNMNETKRDELKRDGSFVIWRLKILILDINIKGLSQELKMLPEAERVLELPFFTGDTDKILEDFLDELDSLGNDFHQEVNYVPAK